MKELCVFNEKKVNMLNTNKLNLQILELFRLKNKPKLVLRVQKLLEK